MEAATRFQLSAPTKQRVSLTRAQKLPPPTPTLLVSTPAPRRGGSGSQKIRMRARPQLWQQHRSARRSTTTAPTLSDPPPPFCPFSAAHARHARVLQVPLHISSSNAAPQQPQTNRATTGTKPFVQSRATQAGKHTVPATAQSSTSLPKAQAAAPPHTSTAAIGRTLTKSALRRPHCAGFGLAMANPHQVKRHRSNQRHKRLQNKIRHNSESLHLHRVSSKMCKSGQRIVFQPLFHRSKADQSNIQPQAQAAHTPEESAFSVNVMTMQVTRVHRRSPQSTGDTCTTREVESEDGDASSKQATWHESWKRMSASNRKLFKPSGAFAPLAGTTLTTSRTSMTATSGGCTVLSIPELPGKHCSQRYEAQQRCWCSLAVRVRVRVRVRACVRACVCVCVAFP